MVFYPCDFESNAEEAKYVSAKGFIEFLHEVYGEQGVHDRVSVHGDSWARRWFRWRNELHSGLISVDHGVDQFLTKIFPLELGINDLPCEIFSFACSDDRKRIAGQISKADRARYAKRVVEGGECRMQIANEAGRSHGAVSKWVTQYRKGTLAA